MNPKKCLNSKDTEFSSFSSRALHLDVYLHAQNDSLNRKKVIVFDLFSGVYWLLSWRPLKTISSTQKRLNVGRRVLEHVLLRLSRDTLQVTETRSPSSGVTL